MIIYKPRYITPGKEQNPMLRVDKMGDKVVDIYKYTLCQKITAWLNNIVDKYK